MKEATMKTKIAITLLAAWALAASLGACSGAPYYPVEPSPAPPPPVITPSALEAGGSAQVVVEDLEASAPAPEPAPMPPTIDAGARRKAPTKPGRKLGSGLMPTTTISDPTGTYLVAVSDAGVMSVSATISGSVSVGSITGAVDGSVVVTNTPSIQGAVDGSVVVTSTVNPAVYATPSQWFGVSAGTVKEAGATLYSLTCYNKNTYQVFIQLSQAVNAPVADAGPAFMEIPLAAGSATVPSFVIVDQGLFTQAGVSFTPGLAWGVSQVTQWYSAATAANINCLFLYK
jgi:hypothetical protein